MGVAVVKEHRRRARGTQPWTTGQPVGPVQREPRSRWRPGYWLRHPAFCLLLAGCYALTVVGYGVGGLLTRRNLQERGELTAGVVERVTQRESMWVQVITPDGEAVSAYVNDLPADRPALGDRVAVVYDPQDPDYAYLPGDYPPEVGNSLLLFGIGLIPTALYGRYLRRTWHRWRNQAEGWRHRRPVPRLGKRQ
ncbi:DUF3592 domain-containing protein [Micromonospora coerulea]|uniref:DUF3592 domain-containing protein n=1 Tax=Micromonospora coerulea TaxID=47856 RepID=UPI0031F91E2E